MKISVLNEGDAQTVSTFEEMVDGTIYEDVNGAFRIKDDDKLIVIVSTDRDNMIYALENPSWAIMSNAPLTPFKGKITLSNE